MDTVTLVGNQVNDGLKLLDRLQQEEIPVKAACWVKPAEEDRWSLYISTPLVEQAGPLAAYRKVYGCLRSLESLWITDSDIKLIGENHPITKDVLDLTRRYPGRVPTRSRRPFLGGVAVEEVYIYPWRDGPSPAREIMLKVLDMIGRPAPEEPSMITLRDGTMLRARPIGIRRLPSGEVEITLHDTGNDTERVISIADVVNLQ
jgi:hypothetical protein